MAEHGKAISTKEIKYKKIASLLNVKLHSITFKR